MSMLTIPTPAARLTRFAQERFDRFTPTSFHDLFSDSDQFLEVSDDLVDYISRNRQEVGAAVGRWMFEIGGGTGRHGMIEFLSHNTRRYVRKNNQFLSLSAEHQGDLADVYRRFLRSFGGIVEATGDSALRDEMAGFLAEHRENLRRFVRSLGVTESALAGGETPHCSEYSPALQARILHIDPIRVAGPVLDIGCGEYAGLVRYLRSCGVDAFGVDRFAPDHEPGCWRGDWLSVPLGREQWGTVISHMAFSHHFLHHHLKGSAAIREYASRYMEILRSLKPGGSFIYAPGLPFIEELLPREKYHVRTWEIAGARGTGFDGAISSVLGRSTFYATHIIHAG